LHTFWKEKEDIDEAKFPPPKPDRTASPRNKIGRIVFERESAPLAGIKRSSVEKPFRPLDRNQE
jgi:hypothetical protein